MTTETLIWLLPLPPVLAFFLIVLFTNRFKGLSHTLALVGAGFSWLASMVVCFRAIQTEGLAENPFNQSIGWLPLGTGWLEIGVQVDPLTTVTLFFVAWTVLMIFIYSIGYHHFGRPASKQDKPGLPPEGTFQKDKKGHRHPVPSIEPLYSRFFALISLFAFGMFLLVVSNNLLTLYVGWEIMGLCSYLLIGFWYGKESARNAALKAFLTTRIGDVFMLLGLVALYSTTGTLNYQAILSSPEVLERLAASASPLAGLSWAELIGVLILIGIIGKSAQFPLHVWLPDAMEGPTPVSAMIHAATMVSAGVYLAVRFFPLLTVGWEVGSPLTIPMLAMGFIGAFTALFAATIALTQMDIKRVLAYSTISQLGFMIAALGVGAYVAAAFHLVTHAFFKALLFLGSGSVIHGMEHGVLHIKQPVDPQDMLNMGGLRKKMPLTFWTFLVGGFALSGFPLVTAGFWSKDEILSGAFNNGQYVIFSVLALAALLTAFYTMRQITLTFLGAPRSKAAEYAHESQPVMTLPLVVLALFAVSAGWVGIPEYFPLVGGLLPNWFEEFVGSMLVGVHPKSQPSLLPLVTSIVVAIGGLLLGWLAYRGVKTRTDPLEKPLGVFYKLFINKYYVDAIYVYIFYRPAAWLAETFSYRWLDLGIIDGFLHATGRFSVWLGGKLRTLFDIPVVNGAGDAAAHRTRDIGSFLRSLQTGHVQQYMAAAIALLVFGGLLFYLLGYLG